MMITDNTDERDPEQEEDTNPQATGRLQALRFKKAKNNLRKMLNRKKP